MAHGQREALYARLDELSAAELRRLLHHLIRSGIIPLGQAEDVVRLAIEGMNDRKPATVFDPGDDDPDER